MAYTKTSHSPSRPKLHHKNIAVLTPKPYGSTDGKPSSAASFLVDELVDQHGRPCRRPNLDCTAAALIVDDIGVLGEKTKSIQRNYYYVITLTQKQK